MADAERLTKRQSEAISELLEAFPPNELYLPYVFPMKLRREPMPQKASEEELRAAEKSLYYHWWEFLKESNEYPHRGKHQESGPIADLYRDFRELGSNFRKWWKRRGRWIFAEAEGNGVRVLFDSTKGGDGADDTYEMLIVEIAMHSPRKQQEQALRQILKEKHPGKYLKVGKLRRAKRALYPNERITGEKTLPKVMEVWRRSKRRQQPNYVQIGLDMKLKRKRDSHPLSRPLRAKDREYLSTRVGDYLRNAEDLLRYAVRGDFPRKTNKAKRS